MPDYVLWLLIIVIAAALAVIIGLLVRLENTSVRLKEIIVGLRSAAGLSLAASRVKGTPREIRTAVEDIAAQDRALKEELDHEKEKNAAILNTMDAGVLLLNPERHVTMLNEKAEQIFGVEGANAFDRSFITLVHDHEMDGIVQECLETGQRQTGTVQAQGSRRTLELTAVHLDGSVLLLVKDLTNVRRLEKTRQDFIANVSHELRTPIASCKAIVETLQNGALKDKNITRDFLQRMQVETDKLAQLVNELGELSRIESGETPLRLERVDLTSVITRVQDRLKMQADRAGIYLELAIPRPLPPVTADAARIEQVLINLTHNAIKFTPRGGKVVIASRVDTTKLLTSVTDTGIGIPADELARIFERFYKVDKARSGGGTGLGLAIVKHIVQAHRGEVWAESVEGKGATFIFSLPLGVPNTNLNNT